MGSQTVRCVRIHVTEVSETRWQNDDHNNDKRTLMKRYWLQRTKAKTKTKQ